MFGDVVLYVGCRVEWATLLRVEGNLIRQAQQLFTVLRTLCVITPTGIANPDSVYWRKFTA